MVNLAKVEDRVERQRGWGHGVQGAPGCFSTLGEKPLKP